jgi:hypothetical protein
MIAMSKTHPTALQVGVTGSKYPAIREHLDDKIGKVYKDLDLT